MRVPSTQALRALDAFARHGSVWRAAEELRLTRSAVSQQLRYLEQNLGFDLLKRGGKGVLLTPQGELRRRLRCQSIEHYALPLVGKRRKDDKTNLRRDFALRHKMGFE